MLRENNNDLKQPQVNVIKLKTKFHVKTIFDNRASSSYAIEIIAVDRKYHHL